MRRHSAKYEAVMASGRWKKLRLEVLRRTGWQCQRCHIPFAYGVPLDAHHWNGYRNLGKETPYDIQILCRACHDQTHKRDVRFLVHMRRLAVALIVGSVIWEVVKYVWR